MQKRSSVAHTVAPDCQGQPADSAHTALLGHRAHHLLQASIASDAAHEEHVLRVDVRHCPFGDFDEHGKGHLLTSASINRLDQPNLHRVAQLLLGELVAARKLLDLVDEAAERDVHALDHVGQGGELGE